MREHEIRMSKFRYSDKLALYHSGVLHDDISTLDHHDVDLVSFCPLPCSLCSIEWPFDRLESAESKDMSLDDIVDHRTKPPCRAPFVWQLSIFSIQDAKQPR